MNNERYSSMMFDIIDSRKLENRYEVQAYMKSIVDYLNLVFEKSLKKPLKFSAGDEVQGLFCSPLAAYICVRFCMILCYPVRIRAGIGYGKLAFDNEKWDSTELDGVVYHNARYALESFKSKNDSGIRIKTDTSWDMYINALFYSSQLIQSDQSSNALDVKLISELLFPLFDEEMMASYTDFIDELNGILTKRSEIQKHDLYIDSKIKNPFSKNEMEKELYFPSKLKRYQEVPVKDILAESDLLVDRIWKKGMSTIISEIIGTTRQNIDKHIRSGKIVDNRVIDFTVAGIFLGGFNDD